MIKEITSKAEWNSVLSSVNTYDFYHTFDYHEISCDSENEKPILITYTKNKAIIALPLLLRKIANSNYYDFTSIYGYGGPVTNNIAELLDYSHYHMELKEYFTKKKIVSVFSRLHPYLNDQENILSNFGNIDPLGKVVNIDITLALDESRRAYQKSLKNQVNKLRRNCNVRLAESREDILEFIDIYYENMKRLNAKDNYFFKKDYFLKFIEKTDFKTDILLVEEIESKKLIAGSMFVKTNKFVQFHLSGTRSEYLKLKPSKLFLDEMISMFK